MWQSHHTCPTAYTDHHEGFQRAEQTNARIKQPLLHYLPYPSLHAVRKVSHNLQLGASAVIVEDMIDVWTQPCRIE